MFPLFVNLAPVFVSANRRANFT